METKSLSQYIKKNKSAVLFLFVTIFGLSLYANCAYFFIDKPAALKFFPPFVAGVNLNHNTLLGAEYYFIAQAIASGKGFSNPFQVDTGPTAWMPPLYSFFLALLIKIFHKKILVAACIVFLKNLVLIFSGLLAYEIAKQTLCSLKPWFVLAIYTLLLLGNFRWYFQITHDSWLLLLFVCVIFPLAVFIKRNHINPAVAITWGIVGGLSMIANPVIGLVWFILNIMSIPLHKNGRLLTISVVIFFLFLSSWIVRNWVVFNRVIAIKSNFYYELYHMNYETENGLFDEEFEKKHPVWHVKNDPNAPYRKLGEIKFLDTYKEKFLIAFEKNQWQYFCNIKNRLCAALIVYYPHHRYEGLSALFNGLLHPLSFLCLILMLCVRGHQSSDYFKTALLIYTIYLIPYIIVSYYVRYSIPLTPLKLLFIAWGVDVVLLSARNGAALRSA